MPVFPCPYRNCTYETNDISDALAVTYLTHHCTDVHPTPAPTAPALPNSSATATASSSSKVEKVRRPTVTGGGTGEEWNYFLTRWGEYKEATNITGKERVLQLLECCEEELRRDITRTAGCSLSNKAEDEVLAAIKILAVREENIMVARDHLWNMRQDHDEPIRPFGARIRGQANMCKYVVTCPNENCQQEVSYMKEILRDVLVRGVADQDIRLDLFQDKNQNMSLDEAFRFIEVKEAGRRSASQLQPLQHQPEVAPISQHKKGKRQAPYHPSTENSMTDSCFHCGKPGHGTSGSPELRSKVCTAYGEICGYCKKPHHVESLCRQKARNARFKAKKSPHEPAKTNSSNNDSLFAPVDSLCGITPQASVDPESSNDDSLFAPVDSLCGITPQVSVDPVSSADILDHHLYDSSKKKWVKKPSKPQPFLHLDASVHAEDYVALGFQPIGDKSAYLNVMADTGCQSCLISSKILRKMGIFKQHLLPVSMKMNTANDGLIDVIGAVVMRLSGRSSDNKRHETRQVVYVTDSCNKIFLSREACTDLGIISPNFPAVGEMSTSDLVDSAQEQPLNPCAQGCPLRSPPPPKPTKLPFAPIKENRKRIEQWLLDYYKYSAFNTCTHQPLLKMITKALRLMVENKANPRVHHKPIPVALHWQDDVKEGIDADCRMMVLERVPIGEPVTWCHQMIVAAKKNGKPRRTVDFQALNTHAIRETHHTQSPFHLARSVPAKTVKTTFDCWNGYHSIPLHPDDRHLTTFITPWGRYRYLVGPQGYAATGDAYTRRLDEITSHIPRKVQCIDDSCLWDDDISQAFFHAVDWLDVCAKNGITSNPEKFVFASETVEFAGFEVSTDCVRPCQKSLQAILNFPTPKSVTDVRSWLGLLNQMAYSFSVAERMQPFRHLLKPGTPFTWTSELDTIFQESKLAIVSEIEEGVQIYDKTKPTCLATDWSKCGIGFWLYQKHCSCRSTKPFCCPTGWKVAMVGSRFTQQAESRYAPIEGEALAVAYALEKAKFFILGCNDLKVAVDHKPLLDIFSDRSLDIPNPRLRNLKEKTLRYLFKMEYVPGLKNKSADALSRYPTGTTDPLPLELPDDVAAIEETESPPNPWRFFLAGITDNSDSGSVDPLDQGLYVCAVNNLHTLKAVTWDGVRTATTSDESMRQLSKVIEEGFPMSRTSLPENIRPYHQFREDLYLIDGVIMYKERIVIPPSLRTNLLNVLHSAHQGVSSMISRAEETIFWPGISKAIAYRRESCNDCNRMAPSQPSAPPYPPSCPSYPFQSIVSDFFQHHGQHYLVIADRYSNWPIVERSSGGSKGLVDALKRCFVTYGIPDDIASDGGPEYKANETNSFLEQWGVHHRKSSVGFPHSNCRAEVAVKTAKRMITSNTSHSGNLDTDAFRIAMLQYRNTPDPATKLSPAMCLFGHPIKDFVPIMPGRYQPHPTWQDTLAKREDALRKRHIQAEERWSAHTKQLPPLRVGDSVRVQNQVGPHPNKWDKTGTVVEVRQFDQYLVRIDGSRRVTLRNRKFLRRFVPVHPPDSAIPRTLPSVSPFASPFPPNPPKMSQPPQQDVSNPSDDHQVTMQVPQPIQIAPDPYDTTVTHQGDSPAPSVKAKEPVIPPTNNARPKVPLALRRLASHNKEGRVGIGEYA